MRDTKGRFVRRSSVPLVAYTAPPTFRNSWPLFLWLLGAAIIYWAAGPALVVLAAVIGFLIGWAWLCRRFPLTMSIVTALLFGGRRR